MSATNGIDFKFAQSQDPSAVLKFLLDNGWSFDVEGEVRYIVPANIHSDHFEWCSEPPTSFQSEKYVDECSQQKRLAIILVARDDQNYGADFIIRDEGGTLGIRDYMMPLFEHSRIPDFSWYLRRLTAMFQAFGVHEVKCSYFD